MKSFLGKFLFDISAPITNNGGDIYLYKGDGLIALWSWQEAVSGGKILHAIDAVFDMVEQERDAYLKQFGVLPAFRIGVHERRDRRQRAGRRQAGHRHLREHDQHRRADGGSGKGAWRSLYHFRRCRQRVARIPRAPGADRV